MIEAYLAEYAEPNVAAALVGFAEAARDLSSALAREPFADHSAMPAGALGPDGDVQKPLDLLADAVVAKALSGAGVRACVSEERQTPLEIDPRGTLLAAVDPLDGSSNIEINIAVGSILSLMAAPDGPATEDAFLAPGSRQKAAAFALYGQHTDIVFTVGAGTHRATLDPETRRFCMTGLSLRIPPGAAEFAINASNARHWATPVKAYVDDCIAGREGPRGRDFNMRWVATMAADAFRVLMRGGVYLYPADARPGYAQGRLHYLYEANPIAFLIEQAGGLATDGIDRILDLEPPTLHARTPLIFGAKDKVEQVQAYFREDGYPARRAPLFNRRGLLRD